MPDSAPIASPKKRGPNTPEGKARSSMNALKHGLRSKSFLILPEEDSFEFLSFAADIRSTYRPKDPVETAHVEAIAVAMWRQIRADRIEGESMLRNKPAGPGLSHGTDLACPLSRASLGTALRYRTQAQMELKRATDLFCRHRKARLEGLLDEAEEASEVTVAVDPPDPCTNEFQAAPEPAPPELYTNEFPPEPELLAAEPYTNELSDEAEQAAAEPCTNEFRHPVPPPPDVPGGYTLLTTYRTLQKDSPAEARAWLSRMPPGVVERLEAAIANEEGPPSAA